MSASGTVAGEIEEKASVMSRAVGVGAVLLLAAVLVAATSAGGAAAQESSPSATWNSPSRLDAEEIDLTRLTSIDYEEGRPLPDSVTELDGKQVVVRGFMHNETSEGTHKFLLVGDGCGCDGTPLVHHFVEVDLGDDVTGYRPELLTVTGRLSVGELRDDGYVVSVYRLVAHEVR